MELGTLAPVPTEDGVLADLSPVTAIGSRQGLTLLHIPLHSRSWSVKAEGQIVFKP